MILFLVTTAFAGPRADLVRPDVLPDWSRDSGTVQLDGPWWESFGDPGLTRLMGEALRSNRDLRAGYQRAQATAAAGRQSFSAVLPTLSFDANAQLAPSAARGFQFGGLSVPGQPEPPKTYWTGSAAFVAGWEPDIFLKNAENIRASIHDSAAAEGDRDAQTLAFATQVAQSYFDLVTARMQVEIIQRQIEATNALLEIVELRYQTGDATAVDLLQQRQQAASSRAQLPLAQVQVTTLEQQLAVALALPPATFVEGVAERLPELPDRPDAGVPADLILNRPDLKAAEARLDASTARKNAAIRQLLPTLRLQGQVGWQAFNQTELLTQSFWTAGATVSIPLFQGGRNQNGIRSARAGESANVHAYTQLAANAVLQVESALVLENQRRAHFEATSEQEQAARQAWDEARAQYLAGVGNYLALLTSQTTLQVAELAKLESRRQLLSARVQLHDALGGTWITPIADAFGDPR